ncbi:HvfC family RiPP maturation protein [Marinicella meishanensis]|uniref:HvfC family RiPP maturation protein n=1 Tax=Marinicella meishanensis TaxID=2873263 RepID=UPI001CC17075|nr:putative DNA-binding domain-containing protein [Marinicella sp. NBU2979]
MSNKPSFKQDQVDFAAHIRDPEHHPIPADIEDRRMDIYRNLFINSISGLLSGSFPVMHSLYADAQWQQLVRQFFKTEHNKTPHFPEIPREFVDFLKTHYSDPQRPFLYELAHYEWLELHLEKHSQEVSKNPHSTAEALLDRRPVVSPLAKVQSYQYPVHQIKRDYQPTQALKQPLFMLIWRDTHYRVQFASLNPFSALLLETMINNQELTGRELLTQLAQTHQHPDPEQFVAFGHQAMGKWLEQDVIIDTQ